MKEKTNLEMLLKEIAKKATSLALIGGLLLGSYGCRGLTEVRILKYTINREDNAKPAYCPSQPATNIYNSPAMQPKKSPNCIFELEIRY
ncbi:MAG: hypothetical protein QXU88_01900 [Candidatus Woesearchaeota archaeon]